MKPQDFHRDLPVPVLHRLAPLAVTCTAVVHGTGSESDSEHTHKSKVSNEPQAESYHDSDPADAAPGTPSNTEAASDSECHWR